MNFLSIDLRKLTCCVVLATATLITACKGDDVEPEPETKTSQQCLDENGPGHFANAAGQCEWSNALVIASDVNHWSIGFDYDYQFMRNGSATSGTGKLRYNNGAVSTFDWQMDPSNTSTIIISNYDNVYSSSVHITLFTTIVANGNSTPTNFSANATFSSGTQSISATLSAGPL
jgi:hypothetical protein